jgi:P-type Ca2+ transporter type 2C
VLSLVLYVTFLRAMFHFSTLHPDDIALCVGADAATMAWVEGMKALDLESKVQ